MQETNRERMQRRWKTEPWLQWQKTERWRATRLKIFERDRLTCQCGCGVVEQDTSLLVCAHRQPHEGNEQLFWDEQNMLTMLKRCAVKRPVSRERHKRGVWS